MSLTKLLEKSKEYSLSQETIDERDNDRLSFIEKFPLKSFSKLKIDEFVLGTDDHSLCYWLEFKDIGAGIGGGNASKFGIYKPKSRVVMHTLSAKVRTRNFFL